MLLMALQLGLYCLMYILLVKCAVGSSGRNCLYFYPKAYMEEAQALGLMQAPSLVAPSDPPMIYAGVAGITDFLNRSAR